MNMKIKSNRWIHAPVIMTMLLALFTATTAANAQSSCGSTYTVVGGDTLSSIASSCEVTLGSLEQANPQITNPSLIFIGQQINIPHSGTGLPNTGGSVYTIQAGDTLSSIATSYGVSLSALEQANPQITNPDLILVGQQINIPNSSTGIPNTGGQVYIIQSGDTLSSIATEFNVSLVALELANPQVSNPDLIYTGEQINIPTGLPSTGGQPIIEISPLSGPAGTQVSVNGSAFDQATDIGVTVSMQGASATSTITTTVDDSGNFSTEVAIPSDAQPGSIWKIAASEANASLSASAQFQVTASPPSGLYTVRSGDTLSSIALMFNITINSLLNANPQITNPNTLIAGQQLYIPGSTAVQSSNGQTIYVVKTGDTLGSIALQFGVTLSALEQSNSQIANFSLIYPGDHIVIP
jgi:LysM repeat protein